MPLNQTKPNQREPYERFVALDVENYQTIKNRGTSSKRQKN